MTHQERSVLCLTLLALSLSALPRALAGELSPPPGPIAPTMKSLAQVEPRTAITSLPMTINTPGSYYLAGNLIAQPNGLNGINVAAANVTIDLNGYVLEGTVNSGTGIMVSTNAGHHLAVRNGTVRGWGGRGIDSSLAEGCRFESVTVESCTSDGMHTGKQTTISTCMARNNGARGFRTMDGSVVVQCTAMGNNNAGFAAVEGCVVSACVARDNARGFEVLEGTTIHDCTAHANRTHGIEAHDDCTVRGNTCTENGTLGSGSGIRVIGTNTRVEANQMIGNDYGLEIEGGGNLVIRNSANGNSLGNYELDPIMPSMVGPILTMQTFSGNMSPHANYDM